jgi:hypothetical protein
MRTRSIDGDVIAECGCRSAVAGSCWNALLYTNWVLAAAAAVVVHAAIASDRSSHCDENGMAMMVFRLTRKAID